MEIEEKKSNNSKILLKVIIAVSIFCGGLIVGFGVNSSNKISTIVPQTVENDSKTDRKEFRVYDEVWEEVESGYIKKELDEKEMVYGSIRGLLDSLGDKYTSFYDPEETKEIAEKNASVFQGIGTTLRYDGEYTVIETPLDGFPAQKAGLMPGDFILEVNGEDMRRQRSHDVADKIMGEAGTNVHIKVYRSADEQIYEFDITRQIIDMLNLDLKFDDSNVAIVNVHKFTESSVTEFNKSWDLIVDQIIARKSDRVILNLRNNPGGFVDSAIHVASEFFPNKTLILSEVDRDDKKVERFSNREGRLQNVKVVVLINSGTASASEIVGGALQDYKKAKLIGQETVGKGLEQKVVQLDGGSSMHLVYKLWLTPNGNNVTFDNPLKPDVSVELTTEDFKNKKDPQMDAAYKELGL